MVRTFVNAAEKEEIIKLAIKGVQQTKIAEITNRSRGTVHNILTKSEEYLNHKQKKLEEREEAILQSYLEGTSWRTMKKELHTYEKEISKVIWKYRKENPFALLRREDSDIERADIFHMLNRSANHSMRQVAELNKKTQKKFNEI